MSNGTILVVDDHEEVRELLQHVLISKGYKVLSASNGEEAIEKVRANGIDLALLDMKMPGMNGIEVLRTIKNEINSSLPVIIMTAYGSPETAVRAMRLGASDYLCKPFDTTEQVATAVKECLDSHRRISKEMEDPLTTDPSHFLPLSD